MRREGFIAGSLVVAVAFGWPVLLFAVPYLWAFGRLLLDWSLTIILAVLVKSYIDSYQMNILLCQSCT